MDDQVSHSAPRHVIESLDASIQDVAEDRVYDAQTVQAEARRLLADDQSTPSAASPLRRLGPTRRTRSTP